MKNLFPCSSFYLVITLVVIWSLFETSGHSDRVFFQGQQKKQWFDILWASVTKLEGDYIFLAIFGKTFLATLDVSLCRDVTFQYAQNSPPSTHMHEAPVASTAQQG